MKWIVVGLLGILAGGILWADESGRVAEGFDRQSFEFRSELLESAPDYRVYRWRFPSPRPPGWPEAAEVAAYYYCPNDWREGEAPRPGVVCLHILGGSGELTRIFAANFASHGIPAVMPIMPMFGERVPAGGRRALLAGPDGARYLAEAFQAIPPEIRRTVDVLLTRPEVNPERLNIMGTSLGGIMGATVAGQDDRFYKAAFLLAGGDFPHLIQHDTPEINPMREALERAGTEARQQLEAVFRAVDPVTYGANLRGKAAKGMVWLLNAEADEVIPKESTLALAASMGLTEEDIEFLPGLGHYTAIAALPDMLDSLVTFFRDETVPRHRQGGPERQEGTAIGRVLEELAAMCRWQPDAGRCLKLTADFVCRSGDAPPVTGRLSLTRGSGEQFQLALSGEDLPLKVNELRCGYGDYPWICSASGKVYAGTLNLAAEPMLSTALDPRWRQYRQLAAGVLGLAALSGSSGLLDKQVQLSWLEEEAGLPTLRIAVRNGQALLQLAADGRTPRRLTVDGGKWQLEADIVEWATDAAAVAADFAPPADAAVRAVDARQLAGAMAAVLNFAIRQGR